MEQWLYLLRNKLAELDIQVQEEVYRSYYKFVYRDIYFVVRDHATSEDVIQEAFLKIITHGPKTHTSNFKSWIRQVTRNTMIDILRKNKKYRHMFHLDYYVNGEERMEAAGSDIETDFEDKTRNELLLQTVNELKPDYRILLLMYYLEGRSYKEIATELNLSEQVVTQRLARARKKLLKYFSRKWVDKDE